MTQEEYVEQQRAKRIDEFAPPKISERDKSKFNFDSRGNKIELNKEIENKTWSDVRRPITPPPPTIGDLSDDTQKGLYFTTKKAEKVVKYKNFVKSQEATPIANELSDEEESIRCMPEKRKFNVEHAEIAPPPTYDYYGPTPKHTRVEKPFSSNMREAMAQGNKSLETKESNRKLPQHYDFTFD